MLATDLGPTVRSGTSARGRTGDGGGALAGAGQYLTFRLGGEEFGIDILKVQEIRGYEAPTQIVGAPPFVKGVLNLRGVIVPVVDLRLKFQLPQVSFDEATVTVILNFRGRVVGAVVDAVSDVAGLTNEQIKSVPEFSNPAAAGFITGMGVQRQDERQRMILLIDIEQLMAGADIGLAHDDARG
jgi:purine-binding chemotaxis protein CheW